MSISVVMTCYNEGAFIGEAVESVLQQTRSDLIEKIIIVDDGSKDDTLAVLADLPASDARIEVLYEKGNGLPRNRNLACGKVSSDWIAILDGDDVWLPPKIERQWDKIEKNPSVGLVYTGYMVFSETSLQPASAAKVRNLEGSRDTQRDYFRHDGPIVPSSIMVKRRDFENVEGFNPEIRVFEDTEFYTRLAQVAQFGFVDESLLLKRVHGGAITAARAQLMAQHAYVAFLIAEKHPRLLSDIPGRLSDRARKLGNVAVSEGDEAGAENFYRLAVALSPLDLTARLSLAALRSHLPLKRIRTFLQSRRPKYQHRASKSEPQ